MNYFYDLILKLFFLISILPFLLSEKLHQKYNLRINHQVVDGFFSGPNAAGKLENKEIDEASGMVVSRTHKNLIYTHNDSGGHPIVFMIDTLAGDRGKIVLEGIENRDWEDIAIGPGPIEGKSYVYVGDIGDNFSKNENLFIYRFPEPELIDDTIIIHPEKIMLEYPDGPKDAETLMIDPWNGDLFILTKRDSSNTLYRASFEELKEETQVGSHLLEKVLKIPITMSAAGDISADGKQILIKNYWVIYYWLRREGESIPQALQRKPVLLPYNPEPQGESIAFVPNGNTYFTLSEKKLRVDPVLFRYDRIKE
ncbi:MAG: hypothetical protein WD398_00665 [Cyclobacteriaceae bacterium]